MIVEKLFPAPARVVFLRTDANADLTNYNDLHPAERVVVSRAVDNRKGEFGDARWCAHQALRELGMDSASAILKGEKGMPLWPEGYTGSLTHTDGLRIAVAAPTDALRSVGIDAEPAQPLPEGVLDQIARSPERHWVDVQKAAGNDWADLLLFCAKEATYKAWFPITMRWLGFEDAEIDIRPDGTFIAYLLVRPTPVPFIEGRWMVRAGYVCAATFIRSSSARGLEGGGAGDERRR